MGIRLVTFYNSTVTPQDDALIYENALPASGMIYGGNVTIKNANTLHITAGHGALCGRKFTIEEDDIPIILTSSGTLNGRLYIHMDLSDTGEPISLEVERANVLTPVVQQSNVNINDGIYEINLATFTISTSTVSDLNYVAPFIKDLDAREVIIAPVEPTNIASSNYAVGKHLILNKILYRVTLAITAGQTITPGTNVTESNSVEEQIEANLSSINTINSNKLNQTVIATRQANLTASKAYAVGEQFVYNNILYRVTSAIAKNAAITIGGNATTADNITTQISNLQTDLSIKYSGSGTTATSIAFLSGWKEAFILVKMNDANARTVSFHVYKDMLPASGKYNLVTGYYYSNADCLSVQLGMNQTGIVAKGVTFAGQIQADSSTTTYVATR